MSTNFPEPELEVNDVEPESNPDNAPIYSNADYSAITLKKVAQQRAYEEECIKKGTVPIIPEVYQMAQNYIFKRGKRIVMHGETGNGKSTNAYNSVKQMAGEWSQEGYLLKEEKDWDKLRPWFIFRPQEFLTLLDQIREYKRNGHPNYSMKLLVWEDASYWLGIMKWQDPFVSTCVEYIKLSRLDIANIAFTTPEVDDMVKGLRRLQGTLFVKIDRIDQYYRRRAKGYTIRRLPDMKHEYPVVETAHDFNCKMKPDVNYYKYNEMRDGYNEIAIADLHKKFDAAVAKGSIFDDNIATFRPNGAQNAMRGGYKPSRKLDTQEKRLLDKSIAENNLEASLKILGDD